MKTILSQHASSQYDPSSRRAAVDTGSEEPGTPPRSPTIGTGSEEPGASRAPFKTSIDGFLNPNFTSTEQEYVLLHQPDVGVHDGKKLSLLHSKPLFARSSRVLRRSDSSKGRQLGLPRRISSLIGAVHIDIVTFLEKIMFACRVYFLLVFPLCFCLLPIAYFSRLVHKLPKQIRKAI